MKLTRKIIGILILLNGWITTSQASSADEYKVLFSQESGFYQTVFPLTLKSPSEQYKVVYTTDCSDPTSSSSAITSADSVTISINPNETTGRAKTPAFVVRAALQEADGDFFASSTRTFIFIDKVKDQQYPGYGWPKNSINNQVMDYEMAGDIVGRAPYSFQMNDALLQLPSISIVTDLKNLVDHSTGIYANSERKGIEWERACSVELINPDGSAGFQINGGLRIRGGNSAKNKDNPKHGFRLFFREEYGAKKLKFPLFGDEGADEFDCVDLRCEQNYSWSMDGSSHNTMIKDIFCRDLQREMGQPYKRGRQYHLYLNGLYWGIYQTDERAEASYAESYFDGDKDDFDVVKVNTQPWPYYDETTDGNLDAWEDLWNLCKTGFASNRDYFKLEGKLANGDHDPDGKVLVDVDNLIDYMLVIFYSGNFDAPVSAWYSNDMPNNFYAIYNRYDRQHGFRFLAHDSEHSMFVDKVFGHNGVYENRTNLGKTGSMRINDFLAFNPQWLHYKLTANQEYRQRFANRAYDLLTHGILSPDSALQLFQERVDEIDEAIIAESARWGDAQKTTSLSRNDDWLPEINKMKSSFFPVRSGILMDQLDEVGLWLSGEAPDITVDTLNVIDRTLSFENEIQLTLSYDGEGTLYYTLDGSDARSIGGGINPEATAIANGEVLTLNHSAVLKAQIKYDKGWGPVSSATFRCLNNNFSNFIVTELHYHPLDFIEEEDTTSGKDYEFIEFKNIGNSIIDLSGLSIDSGISYQFPSGAMLSPDSYFVVASKPNKFFDRYGFFPDGNYSQSLSNSGELIQLSDATGNIVLSFTYSDDEPWPTAADGEGFSLNAVDENALGDPSSVSYWKASYNKGGSPGTGDELKSDLVDQYVQDTPMIYPNPSHGLVHFKTQQFAEESSVTFYDLMGNELFARYLVNDETMDLSTLGLKQGIYLLQIKQGSKTYKQRLTYLK